MLAIKTSAAAGTAMLGAYLLLSEPMGQRWQTEAPLRCFLPCQLEVAPFPLRSGNLGGLPGLLLPLPLGLGSLPKSQAVRCAFVVTKWLSSVDSERGES